MEESNFFFISVSFMVRHSFKIFNSKIGESRGRWNTLLGILLVLWLIIPTSILNFDSPCSSAIVKVWSNLYRVHLTESEDFKKLRAVGEGFGPYVYPRSVQVTLISMSLNLSTALLNFNEKLIYAQQSLEITLVYPTLQQNHQPMSSSVGWRQPMMVKGSSILNLRHLVGTQAAVYNPRHEVPQAVSPADTLVCRSQLFRRPWRESTPVWWSLILCRAMIASHSCPTSETSCQKRCSLRVHQRYTCVSLSVSPVGVLIIGQLVQSSPNGLTA